VIRSSLAVARPRHLLVLAVAALLLAGCEAGTNAPVDDWHPPTPGTDATVGSISLTNVFVLGAPIGQTVPAGGSASVFLALYNSGSPDRLTSISAPGIARSVTLPGGSVSLASQQEVLLQGPEPKVILNDLIRPLAGGSTVQLDLTFQNAGPKSLTVPVMPRAADYATLLPPTPSPSPAATRAAPGATPTPAATPAATASPSATP
jgi:copper(I)-binding protein